MNIQHKRNFYPALFLFLAFFCGAATIGAFAADGDLGPSFDVDGKVIASQNSANFFEVLEDITIQPDGKIVFVGEKLANGSETRIFVGRLTASGVLDPTFSGDVSTTTAIGVTDVAKAIALQPDGKIVVGAVTTAADQSQSQRKFGLARYLNTVTGTPVNNPALRIADFDGDVETESTLRAAFY